MNGQQWAPMCAGFAVAVVLFLVLGYFLRKRDMTAHLAPVKRELKKEKQWLRRGEYNAAKGPPESGTVPEAGGGI